MPEDRPHWTDNNKAAKFISTDDGEFGFVITNDGKLQILNIENETKEEYSSDLIEQLIGFLEENWEGD